MLNGSFHKPEPPTTVLERALETMHASNALPSPQARRAKQRALVRLIAELANAGLLWPDIEILARDVADLHDVDADYLLPLAKTALVATIERQLATGECRCWRCQGMS